MACDCCCSDESVALASLASESHSARIRTLRNVGFRLLYETGEPASVDRIAQQTGWSIDVVEEMLVSPETAGRVRRDDAGRLVGIAGLSIEPTAHEVRIGDRTFWTWCALDAVGIVAALKETGAVFSTPPNGSGTLEIRFVDGASLSDESLFILGDFDAVNTVETWCPSVNFFASRQEATSWAEGHHLEGDVVSISQIAQSAEEMWRPVVTELTPVNG